MAIEYAKILGKYISEGLNENEEFLLRLLSIKNPDVSFDINDITAGQYYDYLYHVVERYDGDGINDLP